MIGHLLAATLLVAQVHLQPTGRHVFCERLEAAPGLVGRFGWGVRSAGFDDPIVLRVLADGVELALGEPAVASQPSQLELRWDAAGLQLVEQAFLTADDLLAVRLTVRNGSGASRDVELRVSGGLTPFVDRASSRQVAVPLPDGAPVRPLELDGLALRVSDAPWSGTLALPSVRPARSELHVLLEPPARGAGPSVQLDDGTSEALSWLGATPRDRVRWEAPAPGGPALLTYLPPPGRSAVSLAGEGLLAVAVEALSEQGRLPVLLGARAFHGQPVDFALAGDAFAPAPFGSGPRELLRILTLPPGGEQTAQIVVAADAAPFGAAMRALAAAEDAALAEGHRAEFEAWFDEVVPGFTCSDPALEAAWTSRWQELRARLVQLDLPALSLPVVLSDRERVSLAEAPEILRDLRWLRDEQPALGQARALVLGRDAQGRLRPVQLGAALPPEPNALAAAVVDAYAVNGSRPFLDESVPFLRPHASPAGLAALAATAGEASFSGAPDCADPCRHADDIVRCVGGIVPRLDEVVELRPRRTDLASFRFDRLPYHGHALTLAWDTPDGRPLWDDLPEGYTLRVDGELRLVAPTLADVCLPLHADAPPRGPAGPTGSNHLAPPSRVAPTHGATPDGDRPAPPRGPP